MTDYPLYYLTTNLVVGRAPMSYADLDYLKDQGIHVIINLCGEFSDLHELEENAGFEVIWIPVADETAPPVEEMEKGLELLDEAVYLGKKVFIHCRHGIGRTGTFITAYLLRRGFSMKEATKMLKQLRATPSNFSQWWLLKKFSKKQGRLTLEKPTTKNREHFDLEPFFQQYELLLETIDRAFPELIPSNSQNCGHKCDTNTQLQFIEALYLHTKANILLSRAARNTIIQQANKEQNQNISMGEGKKKSLEENDITQNAPISDKCPLCSQSACLLHKHRPVECRLAHQQVPHHDRAMIKQELEKMSRDAFSAVFEKKTPITPPPVMLRDVLSGRFIQTYFQHLSTQQKNISQ